MSDIKEAFPALRTNGWELPCPHSVFQFFDETVWQRVDTCYRRTKRNIPLTCKNKQKSEDVQQVKHPAQHFQMEICPLSRTARPQVDTTEHPNAKGRAGTDHLHTADRFLRYE